MEYPPTFRNLVNQELSADGRTERDQDGSFRMRPMSCNASGRAAFSAAAQAAYIATASVAAPAGMPATDARSFTQDIRLEPSGEDHTGSGTVVGGCVLSACSGLSPRSMNSLICLLTDSPQSARSVSRNEHPQRWRYAWTLGT